MIVSPPRPCADPSGDNGVVFAGFRPYAHRGGPESAAENSPNAFAAAVGLGYRFLETDVRPTRDGVAVVHHDATLDRTTDLTGLVRSRPWADVRRAALRDGCSPMRLEELLEAFPDAHVNVDVKESAVVAPTLEALRRTGAWRRVCVTSFSTARLAAVRKATPPWVETAAGPREVVAHRMGLSRSRGMHRRRGEDTRLPHRLQVPHRLRGRPVVDAAFVRRAHARGLAVDVWTVNDAVDMERLLDLGVDGIITDAPALLREVLRSRGRWSP